MTDGERFLRDALASVHAALAQQNWLATLSLTLTLPDICGKVAHPGVGGSQARYEAWGGVPNSVEIQVSASGSPLRRPRRWESVCLAAPVEARGASSGPASPQSPSVLNRRAIDGLNR